MLNDAIERKKDQEATNEPVVAGVVVDMPPTAPLLLIQHAGGTLGVSIEGLAKKKQ